MVSGSVITILITMVGHITRNAQEKENVLMTSMTMVAMVFEDSFTKVQSISIVGKIEVATNNVTLLLVNAYVRMAGQGLTMLR